MTPGPLGIFLRGMAMGAADLVPGVSGGTVALITGVYGRLLAALSAFDHKALTLLWQRDFRGLWQHVDATFLVTLGAGIAAAIFSFAGLLRFLLQTQPLPLWSFFCGLVLVSCWHLARTELRQAGLTAGTGVLLGVLAMVAIGLAPAMVMPQHMGAFFFAGVLGICAMILPGMSGSFILLILGMYEAILTAVVERDLAALAVFALGCAVGLLLFSRLLQRLLNDARQPTMAVLIGLLMGSLVILWPWQEVLQTLVDRHGEPRPVRTWPVTPWEYAQVHGSAELLACLLSAVLGGGLVQGLQRLASVPEENELAKRAP